MNEETHNPLTGYLDIALRRKWWLIVPFLVIFPASVLIAFMLPKVYQASTLILVEPQKVPNEYVKSIITSSMGERLTTIRQQILSRSLLQNIIEEFGLYQRSLNENSRTGFQKTIDKLGFSRESASPMAREEMIETMREKITITTVEERGEVNAFTLSFNHGDPETAMRVTNRLAGMFIEANLQVREKLVEGTSEFLEQELGRLRQTLENQEAKIGQFKKRFMGELPEQLDANLRGLDRFQLELEATQRAIKEQTDRRASFEQQYAFADVLPGQPGSLELRLAELKQRLVNLQAEYHEAYPDIIVTQDEIQEIETQVADKNFQSENLAGLKPEFGRESGLIREAEAELKTLKSKEKTLILRIKEYERRVDRTPIREQELMTFVRDYENTQQNYQALLEKRLNAKISENLEKRQKGERFRILDSAQVSTKPISPNVFKISLVGMMLGLAGGVGLTMLIEQSDTSFHNTEDLEKTTGLVALAAIPNFNSILKDQQSFPRPTKGDYRS